MVLDSAMEAQILNLVRQRPRTMNELAIELDVSWKTADRYVETLAQKDSSLCVHTFRQGTRGALKIVYWNQSEVAESDLQSQLFKRLEIGKRKEDFSPLDIFQFADPERKRLTLHEEAGTEREALFSRLIKPLETAKEKVYAFSGNISWINATGPNGERARDVIRSALDRSVDFKVIARVEIPSIRNIEALMSLQSLSHKPRLEIRHLEQPLRGFLIDDARLILKESKSPLQYKPGELEKGITIFYELWDKPWVAWASRVFSHSWQHSFDAKKRIESLVKPSFGNSK